MSYDAWSKVLSITVILDSFLIGTNIPLKI